MRTETKSPNNNISFKYINYSLFDYKTQDNFLISQIYTHLHILSTYFATEIIVWAIYIYTENIIIIIYNRKYPRVTKLTHQMRYETNEYDL